MSCSRRTSTRGKYDDERCQKQTTQPKVYILAADRKKEAAMPKRQLADIQEGNGKEKKEALLSGLEG